MKKYIFLITCLIFSFSFSQKKELRNANKKFNTGDVEGAYEIINSNKELLENADSKVFNNYVLLLAKILRSKESFEESYQKLKLIQSVKNLADEVSNELQLLSSDIVNSAISDNQQESYTDASKKLYLAYTIDKNAEDYLYYAASSSVNAGNWETALLFYLELKELNYQGIVTKYFVTKIDTGEKLEVDEVQYELFKKLPKEYDQFIKEDTESKFPEIVKNIALIYNQLGMKDDAMRAVSEARKTNPEDVNLILVEANLYIDLDEMEKFKELMIEAIRLKPNDHILFFNLGVVNADQGNVEDALYTVSTDKTFDENTRIRISYNILNRASKFRFFKPCVKKYLVSHVRSRFVKINADQWDTALFLPTERFRKKSKQFVYRESRNAIGR